MATFSKELSFRWSDLDSNFHLCHSVSHNFGAQHRIEILEQLGLTLKAMQKEHIGSVLFREECAFRKEIHLADVITMQTKMAITNQNYKKSIISAKSPNAIILKNHQNLI